MKANTVYIALGYKEIHIHVNKVFVGVVTNANDLTTLFVKHNVHTDNSRLLGCSDVDFCEDYGFKNNEVAKIVREAIEVASLLPANA